MLYMENHDHPRIISRYGSEKFWKESGKMLAAAYLFQKGTPFVYQGQEIGMLNWRPESPEMYEDVQTRWQYENVATDKTPEQRLQRLWRSSRDSARTPVQWDSSENAGFTTGEPWFYVNPNYPDINVAQQEQDPNSILNFYRKAIHLRKALPVDEVMIRIRCLLMQEDLSLKKIKHPLACFREYLKLVSTEQLALWISFVSMVLWVMKRAQSQEKY